MMRRREAKTTAVLMQKRITHSQHNRNVLRKSLIFFDHIHQIHNHKREIEREIARFGFQERQLDAYCVRNMQKSDSI